MAMRIDHTLKRFYPLQYNIMKRYELTPQQGYVFGYLYNHCQNLKKGGYIGYSDERMAEDLDMTIRTFQREMKVLKDKGLIIVNNEGKRSKVARKSREIYINDEIYLYNSEDVEPEEETATSESKELQVLRQQLEVQTKLIEQLQAQLKAEAIQVTFLGKELIKAGYVTKKQYEKDWKAYNQMLEKFFDIVDLYWFNKALKYITVESKKSTVRNKPGYLFKALQDSALQYQIALKNQELASNGYEPFQDLMKSEAQKDNEHDEEVRRWLIENGFITE